MIPGPVLGVETSGRLTGAALAVDGQLRAEICVDSRASSQELLIDLVLRILDSHGIGVRDLSRIGVSLGPGSFTGIRVGLAAVRGMALGAGLPVAGIPSHQALARPWRDLGQRLVLLTGLRRGELYLEAGFWRGEEWAADLPGRGVPLKEVEGLLRSLPRDAGRCLYLGEAAPLVLKEIPGLLDLGEPVLDPLASARRPAPVALLASREIQRATPPGELGAMSPLYLRDADARRPSVFP